MKKILYITLAIFFLGTTACEDYVDVEPTDILDPETSLETVEDFEKALLGAYAVTTSAGYLAGNLMIQPSLIADDAKISKQNRGQYIQMYEWQYTAGDGTISTVWSTIYRMIDRANIIINQIEKLEDSPKKQQILGEALAIRAMGHFDLIRFFADPYTENPNGLGVPYMEKSFIGEPARDLTSVVYEKIERDFNQALGLMKEDLSTDITRLTPLAVKAFLARVHLYKGEWQKAIDNATEVINKTSLADRTAFVSMFTKDTPGEVIYKVAMPQGSTAIGEQLYERANDNAFLNPTNDLLALYDPNADVRFGVYYEPREGKETLISKYAGRDLKTNPGLTDIKVLRVAEMYLIRAEAYFELGQEANALSDLNDLREKRIAGFDRTAVENQETGTALFDAIVEERRKEFAFEGHRWFDLRRWDLPVVRGADCNSQNGCTLPADNFRFTWPIPQDEVFANKNIKQNEGY